MKAAGLVDDSDHEDVRSQDEQKVDIKDTVDGMDNYKAKISGLSLQRLKKEIKERHQSEVYRKVLNIGSKGGAPTSAM